MLFTLVIQGCLVAVLIVISVIPNATHLPFGIDGVLYTVGQWVVQISAQFWPVDIVFQLFFQVYLPFLLVLLVLKFFLGHRAPGRDVS